jgi:translation initiation factor IF-2
VYEGKIGSLKRHKDDAREVAEGFECGIGLDRHDDIKEGDLIEVYQIEKIARRLDSRK